jgi:hypothetical protein
MVEIFFGIFTGQAIRRGTLTSIKDLIAAIETFIEGWDDCCQPSVWTTEEVPAIAQSRPTSSNTRH